MQFKKNSKIDKAKKAMAQSIGMLNAVIDGATGELIDLCDAVLKLNDSVSVTRLETKISEKREALIALYKLKLGFVELAHKIEIAGVYLECASESLSQEPPTDPSVSYDLGLETEEDATQIIQTSGGPETLMDEFGAIDADIVANKLDEDEREKERMAARSSEIDHHPAMSRVTKNIP